MDNVLAAGGYDGAAAVEKGVCSGPMSRQTTPHLVALCSSYVIVAAVTMSRTGRSARFPLQVVNSCSIDRRSPRYHGCH